MKRPSFQFYPGDWQRDAGLRLCSVGARGCWIEMMCIMHQADPYGSLCVNGHSIEPDQLARMIGATSKEVRGWLKELENAGVFDRMAGDIIVSRRMVRDERVRRSRAEGGKLGGNPTLKKNGKGSSKVDPKVNLPPNHNLTPSSSSSSSFNSVPDGTDGEPSPKTPEEMTKDELWKAGKSLLAQAGMPAAQCGSFVGKLVKDYSTEIVIESVRAAVVERPADPASYLKAACQRRTGERAAAAKRTPGRPSINDFSDDDDPFAGMRTKL